MSLLDSIRSLLPGVARKKDDPLQASGPYAVAAVAQGPPVGPMLNQRNTTPPPHSSSAGDPPAGGKSEAGSAGARGLEMPRFLAEEHRIRFLADVPGDLRERIQREGMARALRRLETPLRALYMATTRKGSTYPAEELRGFLLMWRQALADYVGLTSDDRTVITYDRQVDKAYFVRGRCQVGTRLSVLEPCWMLNGEVVVRGEAQAVDGGSR